jgi:tetratricopeptide (TPR) repeat protein
MATGQPMARVFLSYDRDDVATAQMIARALEEAGHSVWWDRHIRGGAQFSKEIEQALNAAEAVIVLWSVNSIESAWVRDEAAVARDDGRLIPATIDGSKAPLGFRQFHTIDLSRRTGHSALPELQTLLADVAALASNEEKARPPSAQKAPAARLREAPQLKWWLIGGLIIGLLFVILGLAVSRPWDRGTSKVATVAVRAGNQTPYARELARDLLVGLGDAQSVGAESLQLVDANSRAAPDLIVEVSGAASGPRPTANLVLLRGSNRQLLASHDLETSNSTADLKASLAASAAVLLGCATEALTAPGPPLPPAELKFYLGICGQFATVYGSPEPAYALASQFERVVAKAPRFTPALKKLLLLEASLQTLPDDHDKPSPEPLRRHLVEARRLDAEMPEADVAEAELLPTIEYAARIELVDRAISRAPNDPLMFLARAWQLMRIGRQSDAIGDVEQAVTLDRFSPAVRTGFVYVLAYSGRWARAVNELDEAQRLWPTAHNLLEVRFRLNFRTGDPNVSLQIMRAHGSGASAEALLPARINPTPANIERAIAVGEATAARFGSLVGGHVETLAIFERDNQAYEFLMRLPPQEFDSNLSNTLFRPTLRSFRQQPRFLAVAKRFGLLDYWRKSGKWPDFCSDPDLGYDCKAQAAKLG